MITRNLLPNLKHGAEAAHRPDPRLTLAQTTPPSTTTSRHAPLSVVVQLSTLPRLFATPATLATPSLPALFSLASTVTPTLPLPAVNLSTTCTLS